MICATSNIATQVELSPYSLFVFCYDVQVHENHQQVAISPDHLQLKVEEGAGGGYGVLVVQGLGLG